MKKIAALLVVTGGLLLFALRAPEAVQSFVPQTGVVRLAQASHRDVVTANGVVENNSRHEITASMPLIADQVAVTVGDTVRTGDVVMTVDVEETIAQLLKLRASGYASQLTAGVTLPSGGADEMRAIIPETITADASGTVVSVGASAGSLIQPKAAVVSLARTEDIIVKLTVTEADIWQVAEGQLVAITGAGFPEKTYTGTVWRVAGAARKQYVGSTQETVVDVMVKLDVPDGGIKAGYSVKAAIAASDERIVKVIPFEAVMQDDVGQEYVYCVEGADAKRRDITTGEEYDYGVEVLAGLDEADLVVANPSDVKGDGGHIRVKR